jgi:hypothetical protein
MDPSHGSNCPDCGTAYGPFDGLEVVRTKTGRRLERWIFPVTGGWCLLLLGVAVVLSGTPSRGGTLERGFGWMLVGLPAIPGFVLWMASWFFPQVRRYRCRHCGRVTEVPFHEVTVPAATHRE